MRQRQQHLRRLACDEATDGWKVGIDGSTTINVRGWSGYPPKLSVKADIPARQPSATKGELSRGANVQEQSCGSRLSGASTIADPLASPPRLVLQRARSLVIAPA
jgi:hypothetical protein